MRNPDWHRDEIIIALNLYFDSKRGSIDKNNPKVIEVSQTLNALPLFSEIPDKEKFRNPNGVSLKLSNFLAIDPSYTGKGMSRGSDLDRKVFMEFYNDRERLKRIASSIKKISEDSKLKNQIYEVGDDELTKNDSVVEGAILYKLHKVRERDKKIVISKKKQVFNLVGKLACEVCSFEFESYYGEIGRGFIECHHKSPLAKIQIAAKTKLEDLALVCSNCHRMLHVGIDCLSIDDLRMIIKYDRI
ncbi:MAG: HNH endonuclease [Ferruginibacter sp.]